MTGSTRARRDRRSSAGVGPLAPDRLWRALVISTVLLLPAFWSLLVGFISAAEESEGGPNPAAAIAFGVSLLPFVLVAAAFLTQHPSAPGAAARGMGVTLLVGIPVLALAGDAVTGLVAGIGAGAVVVVRRDPARGLRHRVIAVALASAYTFVLVRVAGAAALLSAPVFPFTAVGLADMLAARAAEREEAA